MAVLWVLLRVLFVLLLGYVLFKLLWPPRRPAGGSARTDVLEPMERDPVCGAFVPRSQAVRLKTKGEAQYFCSEACRKQFEDHPDQFAN